MPLGAGLWHYAAELRTLSVTYPLCGSALANTTDNLSELCPLKLPDFSLFFVPLIIHNLTRAVYSPNGFHKLSRPGSNRLPPDGKPRLDIANVKLLYIDRKGGTNGVTSLAYTT